MHIIIFRPQAVVRSLAILVLITAVIACQVGCMSRSHDISPRRGLELLLAIEAKTAGVPERTRWSILGAAYDEMFRGLAVDRVSADELAAWYRAARIVAFYSNDPARARTMARLLDALQQRGCATDRDYARLYETYVGARMFDDARALAIRHPLPTSEALPAIREAEAIPLGLPSEWAIDPADRALIHRRVRLDENAQLVVVSHPTCHFSQQAVADIEQEPDLRAAVVAHGTWLAPQSNHLDIDVIGDWNRRHPGLEIALVVRSDDWPMLDSWDTPTFYVLEHGKVVAKVEGWPKEGRRNELRAAMRRVGLLP
jgi:hypothetical protein